MLLAALGEEFGEIVSSLTRDSSQIALQFEQTREIARLLERTDEVSPQEVLQIMRDNRSWRSLGGGRFKCPVGPTPYYRLPERWAASSRRSYATSSLPGPPW